MATVVMQTALAWYEPFGTLALNDDGPLNLPFLICDEVAVSASS